MKYKKSPCRHVRRSHKRKLQSGEIIEINAYEAGTGSRPVKTGLGRSKKKKVRDRGFFN